MADRRNDDVWLDALRGRARSDTLPDRDAAWREGEELRRALHDLSGPRAHDATPDDPEGLQRLLFRLRREGLLDAGRPAASPWKRRGPVALAAALALGVALTLLVQTGWRGDDDTLRSGSVQSIAVDGERDILATVARIEAALRGVGAEVQVVDIGNGAREIAATVPADRIDEARRTLRPLGVAIDGNGVVRIEVRKRAETAK